MTNVPTYSLAEHVLCCESGSQVVLLDRKKWEYRGIDVAQARVLTSLVQGLPVLSEPLGAADVADVSVAEELIQLMCRERLLTTRAIGKPTPVPILDQPSKSFFDNDCRPPPWTIQRRHCLVFAQACVVARIRLLLGMGGVIRTVAKRKARASHTWTAHDLQRANQLTHMFYYMRPFVFTGANKCLFDSFALANFLARFELYPQWVFAVSTMPFSAHCWLQQGDTLFNDSIERVECYTPLMVL